MLLISYMGIPCFGDGGEKCPNIFSFFGVNDDQISLVLNQVLFVPLEYLSDHTNKQTKFSFSDITRAELI